MTRKPCAYRLDDAGVKSGDIVVIEEPLDAIEAADGTLVPVPARRRAPWVGILLSALGGLVLMAIGLEVETLIVDLYGVRRGSDTWRWR